MTRRAELLLEAEAEGGPGYSSLALIFHLPHPMAPRHNLTEDKASTLSSRESAGLHWDKLQNLVND